MKILGISGSLRQSSFNTRLLEAAGAIAAEEGSSVELFDLSDIPFYNEDIDGEQKPDAVAALIEAIDNADGLLFASPEYNYSVSGVLKNAIDWASRPAYKSVLAGKPSGIVSASVSPMGGVRGQIHLRDILAGTLTPVYPAPDYLLAAAQEAFDGDGALSDATALRRLDRLIKGFMEWVKPQMD